MGSGASSCLHSTVDPLHPSAPEDEGDQGVLEKLSSQPALLSKPVPGLSLLLGGVAQTWLHVACERKHVHVVRRMCQFLGTSSLATVREALVPYCRRMGLPLPETVAEGVRLAVGMCNGRGQTPLMHACYAGCAELVKLLLDKGADPWVIDRCGCRVALHYAAIAGCAACVAALMQSSAAQHLSPLGCRYVDSRSLSGLTSLHYAVYYERHEVLRELLRHNPDINAATSCSSYDIWLDCDAASTPLHFAAVRGNSVGVQELLRYYAGRRHTGEVADPRLARNSSGRQPWHLAASQYPSLRYLTVVLQPGQPLTRIVGGDEGAPGTTLGAASLAAIAAAALRKKLLASVVAAEAEVAAAEAALAAWRGGRERGRRSSGSSAYVGSTRSSLRSLLGGGKRAAPPLTEDTNPAPAPRTGSRLAPAADLVGGDVPLAAGGPADPPSSRPPLFATPRLVSLTRAGRSRSFLTPSRLQSGPAQTARVPGDSSSGIGGGGGATSPAPSPRSPPTGGPSSPSVLAVVPSSHSLQEFRSEHHPFGVQSNNDPHPLGVQTADLDPPFAPASPLSRASSRHQTATTAPLSASASASASPSPRDRSRRPPSAADTAVSAAGAADTAAGAAGPQSPRGGGLSGGGDGALFPAPSLHRCGTSLSRLGPHRPPLPDCCFVSPGRDRPLYTADGYFLDAAIGAAAAATAVAVSPGSASPAKAAGGTEGDGTEGDGTEGDGDDVARVKSLPCGETGGLVPVLATAGKGARTSQVGGDKGEEDELEATCNVCFARRKSVAPGGCRHGVCVPCARELCHGIIGRPLLCPFCRQPVSTFVALMP